MRIETKKNEVSESGRAGGGESGARGREDERAEE
jgi:hypothetical protein